MIEISYPNKTAEILDLAQQLIRIPSVTACPTKDWMKFIAQDH